MLKNLITIVALASSATAQAIKGFNYGPTNPDGSYSQKSDFVNGFSTAQKLVGAPGFNSARLYTMIQGGTTDTTTEAIAAAIDTSTTLLLGLWASAGQADFTNEVTALTSAITQYKTQFTDLVIGISVGSEDLYRISPTGIENNSGAGAEPSDVVNYIQQVRTALSNAGVTGIPVGHVDTWTAWVNGSNDAVIANCDFLGVDAYPYYQYTMANSIQNGESLFNAAYQATLAASEGKPVWVTETGWPVSGATENEAVPSIQNAQTYWDQVGCGLLFGQVNTWWYQLAGDAFGVCATDTTTSPLYDLSCSSEISASVPSPTPTSPSTTATNPIVQTKPAAGPSTDTPTTQPSGGTSQKGSAGSSAGSSASAPTTQSSSGTGQTASTGSSTSTPTPAPSSGSESPSGSRPESVSGEGSARPNSVSTTFTTTTSSSGTAPSSVNCPAALHGNWQFPHLIVPVSPQAPTTAYSTSYNGTVSPTISTVFNFDIPTSYAGLACSLIFLFPEQSQLSTSSYTFSGRGGLTVTQLSSPATESTTYDSLSSGMAVGGVSMISPGESYVLAIQACAAGKRVGYEVSAVGDVYLDYFQDYNQTPIGLYVVAC